MNLPKLVRFYYLLAMVTLTGFVFSPTPGLATEKDPAMAKVVFHADYADPTDVYGALFYGVPFEPSLYDL